MTDHPDPHVFTTDNNAALTPTSASSIPASNIYHSPNAPLARFQPQTQQVQLQPQPQPQPQPHALNSGIYLRPTNGGLGAAPLGFDTQNAYVNVKEEDPATSPDTRASHASYGSHASPASPIDGQQNQQPPRKKQKRNKPTLSCQACVERKTKVCVASGDEKIHQTSFA